MVRIRKMLNDDFEYAVNLTDTLDWNLSENDFKFMLNLEPEGCFVATVDSEKVGITTTICYNGVGWIGNVIVDKNFRNKKSWHKQGQSRKILV